MPSTIFSSNAKLMIPIINYILLDSTSIESSIDYNNTILLGEALFHDTSLSARGSQSCATCHNPSHAFIDDRENSLIGASLGDDGISLADRNAPMVTYSAFIPSFRIGKEDENLTTYKGGQFWDGRSLDLVEQAKQPFLNPDEMQMSDEASVVERVLANDDYVRAMKILYGDNIFSSDSNAFNAVADAIATFESSSALSTFDSRYDKSILGDITLTDEEQEGEALFISSGCIICHNNEARRDSPTLFTFFGYQNIGIPKNTALRNANNKGETFIDHGLLDNPNIDDSNQDGRFRVPSLRNVAVSAPYMHNGVFKTLKAVVHFYNTRDLNFAINPETNEVWRESEVLENRFRGIGNLGLNDSQEDAIIAFLKTLTDERYESYIE